MASAVFGNKMLITSDSITKLDSSFLLYLPENSILLMSVEYFFRLISSVPSPMNFKLKYSLFPKHFISLEFEEKSRI